MVLFTALALLAAHGPHKNCSYNTNIHYQATAPTPCADPRSVRLQVQFSYSVKWRTTDITFAGRMARYSRYSFLPQHLEVSKGSGRPHA